MGRARKGRKTAQPVAKSSASKGTGLDKATLHRTLDHLIETMDVLNRELEELLAKAKGGE